MVFSVINAGATGYLYFKKKKKILAPASQLIQNLVPDGLSKCKKYNKVPERKQENMFQILS